MRSQFTLALVLIGLSVTACGGGSKGGGSASQSSSRTAAATSTGRYLNDSDNDNSQSGDSDSDGDNNKDIDKDSQSDYKSNDNSSYHDGDDIIAFGHAASAADSRRVTAVVKRYYAAAAEGDGAKACQLIYPVLAKAIPEDYGQAPGPAYTRGKTCPVVMSKLLEHLPLHAADLAAIQVTDVHVNGNEARALLGSKTIPASFILLQRDRRAWKIDMSLGRSLP